MSTSDKITFLNLRRTPAKLDAAQTGYLLGFSADHVRLLARMGLLRSLTHSLPHNAVKYFAAVDVENLMADRAWLEKATKAIYRETRDKNRH